MSGRAAQVTVLALVALAVIAATPSRGDVIQRGGVRVGFESELRPRALPREGTAPVSVRLEGRVLPVGGGLPPRLDTLRIGINRHGHLDPTALPACTLGQILAASTRYALAVCGRSLVGEGRFSAKVAIPGQSPFPSRGRVVAFNGRYRGGPAILAHVYGTKPAPTSFTLPMRIGRARGTFATLITASLPRVATNRAYVTGLSMTLGGPGVAHGSYLRAGCPAPSGFPGINFPLAQASFEFAGGPTVRTTEVRACKVSG
jgi:hypothetical protein